MQKTSNSKPRKQSKSKRLTPGEIATLAAGAAVAGTAYQIGFAKHARKKYRPNPIKFIGTNIDIHTIYKKDFKAADKPWVVWGDKDFYAPNAFGTHIISSTGGKSAALHELAHAKDPFLKLSRKKGIFKGKYLPSVIPVVGTLARETFATGESIRMATAREGIKEGLNVASENIPATGSYFANAAMNVGAATAAGALGYMGYKGIKSLFDKKPGAKASGFGHAHKYIRRTGSPGGYHYIYAKRKGIKL
jgi:hypothetical protein